MRIPILIPHHKSLPTFFSSSDGRDDGSAACLCVCVSLDDLNVHGLSKGEDEGLDGEEISHSHVHSHVHGHPPMPVILIGGYVSCGVIEVETTLLFAFVYYSLASLSLVSF